MAIKKQIVVLSMVYREEDTHSGSAIEAVAHHLYNEDGILEWDFDIKKEEVLSAEITDVDWED